MNYSTGKTPAIDEIIIKTLVIPVLSPDINPLDSLVFIRDAIEQVLDKDLPPEDRAEISKHYESFSPSLLKAALRVINKRISYANALDEYLEVLYRENVGTDSGLTPHAQVESTPRFNYEEIDYHLKVNLLQGTDDDVRQIGNNTIKSNTKNTITKTLDSAYATSFLIAEKFATGNQFKKPSGGLNIDSISKAVSIEAQSKHGLIDGQSDSSIRNCLNNGKKHVSDT